MAAYRDSPTPTDRAAAVAGVIAVHALIALVVLSRTEPPPVARQAVTQLIDVPIPPPPPPPPTPDKAPAPAEPSGKAGKKARPTPIVAPPRTRVPPVSRVAAAAVPGPASAPTAGVATSGSGSGAGGSGTGPGGGGSGGTGFNGIGEDARLLGGGLTRRDYRALRAYDATSGRAVLALMIGPDGRVAQCSIRQSSGSPALDAALCDILGPRMLWSPARDRAGRPLTVGIYYTATWNRD